MAKGYIRPVTLDDASMILTWRNQDFVRNNMYNNNIISYETHIKWFQNMLKDDTCQYFIYEKDNQPMGVVGFYDIDLINKKSSWAFYLGSENYKGAGVEMEQLALDYAFNTLSLYKLYCEVLSFNSSVIEFHKKFGFNVEGIRRKDYFREGNHYDIYQLALFKDEYEMLCSKPNIKLAKTYSFDKEFKNVEITKVISWLFDVHKEYPGEPYFFSHRALEVYNDIPIDGVVKIKAKLIKQSSVQAKIEYIATYNDEIILNLDSTFIKK